VSDTFVSPRTTVTYVSGLYIPTGQAQPATQVLIVPHIFFTQKKRDITRQCDRTFRTL
jgi:hypothetical protein